MYHSVIFCVSFCFLFVEKPKKSHPATASVSGLLMMASDLEKKPMARQATSTDAGSIRNADSSHPEDRQLHRRLNNRQIQLIATGGSIGTALFISIGGALAKGGPGSLLLAFTLYTMVLALVNNGMAEMNTYMPVEGGFVRLAGY